MSQAQKAVAARKKDADATAAALEACQKRLADAKAAPAQSKAKQSPAASAGSSNGNLANGHADPAAAAGVAASPSKDELDAKFALPERLKEYTGMQGYQHRTGAQGSSRCPAGSRQFL